MSERKIVEIIEFTDPVCTWCWGSEPLLRTLEIRYGDQLQVKYVMGGLVEDIRAFYDSYNDIGGDVENSNKQIASHWLEASERHGMPVKVEGFRMFSEGLVSTYPQNIAYKAAQMENQPLADKFLRRMREASAAEARQTNKQDVLLELASEVGLDLGQFLNHLNDGSAEAAFKDDLNTTRKYGVRGFPTYLIRYGEKEMLVRSFQDVSTFHTLISKITEGAVQPSYQAKTNDEVIQFIRRFGRVAPVEIEKAFDFSITEVQTVIENLIGGRIITVIPAGNGVFFEPVTSPLVFDATSGVCSI
jgi:putative protein-disulfide isomerase